MRALAYSTLVFAAAFVGLVNMYPWILDRTSRGVVELEIPRGAPVNQVAALLAEGELIANEDVFVAGAVFLGIDRKIVAGKYVFPPRMNLMALYQHLQRGQIHLNLVTVPEGLTLVETVEVLADELGLDKGEMEAWAKDADLVSDLGVAGESAEGYLFPDTYDIPPDTHPRDIVSTMVHRAIEAYAGAISEASPQSDMSRHEVFTLASIVEAEVTYDDEAPRVAAVFLNRLYEGMPLQADPTVAYALGERKPRITYGDLKVDSPYNTYRHTGLPPGPICSPGERSIMAVLNPDSSSSDMYFVARGDGRHVFSETMDEHVRAKRRIREARRQR
jgi:UPF0755 protein